MKLTVLVDNHTYIDRYYLGEPAVSYLIEDGEHLILFDMGYSDVFLENAKRMGIDLGRVTDIVLSHGHNDHTGGLPAFFARFTQPVRLFAHLSAFLPKRHQGADAGSPMPLYELPRWVSLQLGAKPRRVSEHIWCLGEVPRIFPFELDRAVGETLSSCGCCWESDTLRDDTALVLALPEGAFVVTGCAHAGVCNTVAYAKQVSGASRTLGLLGGFHLFETGEALDRTLAELRNLGVERVYPAHCTSLPVKAAFVGAFDTVEVGVGLQIDWQLGGTPPARSGMMPD
ncbi:MAG: MBL fold metallo-hydrolase [Christensenella sp.]|nr:MBL fold metallo-hydrolase [Christensenella sp.]